MSDLKKLSAVSGGVCRFFMLSMMTSLCHSKPGGCKMTIKDTRYDVEGTLVAFVGDTPAVNMAGGFKEGVGGAMRKCRHCLAINSHIQMKVCHPCASCTLMHYYNYYTIL